LDSLKERFTLETSRLRELARGLLTVDSSSPNATLLEEIEDGITQLQLVPSIRSSYYRSAYQNGEDLSIRYSLDEDLTFYKESSSLLNPMDIDWSPECANKLPPQDVHRFAYAILEVKIQRKIDQPSEGMPEWVTMLEDLGCIIEISKYSKFLTAVGLFYIEELEELPSWFGLMAKPELLEFYPQQDKSVSPPKVDDKAHIGVKVAEEKSEIPKANLPGGNGVSSGGGGDDPNSRLEHALTDKHLVHRNLKVGPKLCLSNERTFLNWAANILGAATFGGILMQQDQQQAGLLVAGILVVLIGILVLIRVLFKYRMRVQVVRELGEPIKAYSETFAPIVFTLLLIAIMSGVMAASMFGLT